MLLYLMVVVYLSLIKTSSQNVYLISDYLAFSHIKTVLYISCDNTSELIKIFTELYHIDSYVNLWSIRNESNVYALNYTQLFVRVAGPHVVALDLKCRNVHTFLKVSSQKWLFHYERTWVIFSNNMAESHEILERQNINMDANVVLAIQMQNGLV